MRSGCSTDSPFCDIWDLYFRNEREDSYDDTKTKIKISQRVAGGGNDADAWQLAFWILSEAQS